MEYWQFKNTSYTALFQGKYLISKVIVGTLHALFIILLPVLIISVGMGIIGGFQNYNYPVLYLEEGFQTFKSLPNYIKRDFDNNGWNYTFMYI